MEHTYKASTVKVENGYYVGVVQYYIGFDKIFSEKLKTPRFNKDNALIDAEARIIELQERQMGLAYQLYF